MKLHHVPLMIASLIAMAQHGRSANNRSLRNGRKRGSTSRSSSGKSGSRSGSGEGVLNNVVGALFTQSNGNGEVNNVLRTSELVMYHQMADGSLKGPVGKFPTADFPKAASTSQHSIIVSEDMVFVAGGIYDPTEELDASAGGPVSAFKYTEFGALRTDVVRSGGRMASALAIHGRILYTSSASFEPGPPPFVFDFQAPNSINAFHVEDDGTLSPLPELTQETPTGDANLDLVFTKDKKWLVTGQFFGNEVRAYRVDKCGRLDGTFVSSAGNSQGVNSLEVHYMDGKNYIYAGNGGTGTVSAFVIDEEDSTLNFINTVESSGPNTALCWIVRSGRYLYTANAGVNAVSSYVINEEDGSVELLELVSADTTAYGDLPFDFYEYDGYLYLLLAASGVIVRYNIESDGSLTFVDTIGGLPQSLGEAPFTSGASIGLAGGTFHF